jgi:thioredoxin
MRSFGSGIFSLHQVYFISFGGLMAATLPSSFNDLIRDSDLPVLVDFWAEWCGPCHAVAPVIEQIAREYKGRLRVVKVNIDQKPQVAQQFQVQSIPTIMLFHRGAALMRELGAQPYGSLKQRIDSAMARAAL